MSQISYYRQRQCSSLHLNQLSEQRLASLPQKSVGKDKQTVSQFVSSCSQISASKVQNTRKFVPTYHFCGKLFHRLADKL